MNRDLVRRIGVFKMRNIGDVLVATPALRTLREFFPQARITVIVYSGTEAMLAHNPHVDEVLVYRQESKKWNPLHRAAYELGFLWALLRRRFDLTVGCNVSDRIAWYSVLLGWTGTPWRIGWFSYRWKKKDLRWRAYTHTPPEHYDRTHEVEKHRLLLASGGIIAPSGPLCLVIPEKERAWARTELAPLRGEAAGLVHVHPVSRWLWKCWRNEAVAEVIDWLQRERNVRVVLTTGPVAAERARAQQILALCQTPTRFYDGTLSLTQLGALSAEADLFFGVDTAPMHIAAAVGTPVVALFGPTSPEGWGPWTEKKRVIAHPCPCGSRPQGDCSWEPGAVRACLAGITVDEVKNGVEDLLKVPARV